MGGIGVTMEDFSGISQGVKLYSASDDYTGASLTNPTIPKHLLKVIRGEIRLGRHVIIGAGTVVLPGVEIGEGSSVGALSLVRKDLDPWGVYSGAPVRRLKSRDKTLLADEALLS